MLLASCCGGCHALAIPRTVRAGRHGPSRGPRSAGRQPHASATPRDAGREAPLDWMRHSARVPIAETAASIRTVGAQHFVLGTDLGQTGNPTPADGLAMYVAALEQAGISPSQIQTMGREVPGALLMG